MKSGTINDQINLDVHAITELQNAGVKPTNDLPKYDYKPESNDKEANYIFAPCVGTVIALRSNNQFVDQVSSGNEVGILLDQTNFYAEQGGQIFDEGFMVKVDDEVCKLKIQEFNIQNPLSKIINF